MCDVSTLDAAADDAAAERALLVRTVQSLRAYSAHALLAEQRAEDAFRRLSPAWRACLDSATSSSTSSSSTSASAAADAPECAALVANEAEASGAWIHRQRQIRVAIAANQMLLDVIADGADAMFAPDEAQQAGEHAACASVHCDGGCNQYGPVDLDKARTTLRQFVRDWSAYGHAERQQCYGPIVDALQKRFPGDAAARSSVRVLVPGAGLGRLVFDLAQCGFDTQGATFVRPFSAEDGGGLSRVLTVFLSSCRE